MSTSTSGVITRSMLTEKKEAVVSNDEQLELKLTPGIHRIYARIDWGYSQPLELDLKAGEVRNIAVGGFKRTRWLLPSSLVFAIASQLAVNFSPRFSWLLLILALPGFLILMYYITFGRKKYLRLTEHQG